MAFAGMFILFVIILLIIAGIMLTLSLIFLIVGIIRKVRRKKSGLGFFIASGVLFALVVIPVLILMLPVRVDIDTPNGKRHVWSNQRDEFYSGIYVGDTEKVGKLLDKYPDLVYVVKHGDNIDGLHAAVIRNDIDTARCIIEHGGAFDSGYNFSENEYDYSLECYFRNYYRRANLENTKYSDYECVKFMIDNNAEADFSDEHLDVLFYAIENICFDGKISDDEVSMIKLIIDSGADINAASEISGDTPLDSFLERANNIDHMSEEDINKIVPLLTK